MTHWTELSTDERQYCATALWSSTDDKGNPLDDDFDVSDIGELEEFISDWQEFRDNPEHGALLEPYDINTCAHDFWLTRNGHGAGFWDGDYSEHGDELTACCKPYGTCDFYVGDDDKLYFM